MTSPRSPGRVSYSQCWEDPDTVRVALRVTTGDDVLIVTSGGCNALSVAMEGPRSVTSVDVNQAQNHLLELKKTAITTFQHAELLSFLGLRRAEDRWEQYGILREGLPPACRDYWDIRPNDIRRGVVHMGRFERYLSAFRKFVLPVIHTKNRVEEALKAKTMEEQRDYYDRVWNTLPWRLLFRAAFGRQLLSRFARFPGAFRNVELPDVASHYLGRVKHALTGIPVADNYFLEYMATGGYRDTLPVYLNEASIDILRNRLCQVRPITANLLSFLKAAPCGAYSKFHFSDVFEYFDDEQYSEALLQVARISRPGGRLCFYNNLVERTVPGFLESKVQKDEQLAEKLHHRDRSFLYRSLVVAQVDP